MVEDFEYTEDRECFESIFGDLGGVESFIHHFDFCDPQEKRKKSIQEKGYVNPHFKH